jgi:hypothetical protein
MSRSGHLASRKDRVSGGVLQILVGMMALALAASTLTGLAAAATALPDWSGTWQNQGPPVNTILFDGATSDPPGCDATYPPCREHPPYNAKWEARYLALNAKYVADTLPDPLIRCIPRGMPGDMRTPDAMEFVVRPERVWMFIENGNQARRIYTDGRGHRKGADAFHSFTGDSIGHWEGDTLVVDTVHLQGDLIIDRTGAILSNQAHIVERIRRRDAKTMQDDFTITDPGALTRPWKVTRLYKPVNGEILDYACAENNRNPISGDGHTLAVGPHGEPLERTSKGKPNEK